MYTVIIHLYSEMEPRIYHDVERRLSSPIGSEEFVYLRNKDDTCRCYINVKDIRRMTIEESEDKE